MRKPTREEREAGVARQLRNRKYSRGLTTAARPAFMAATADGKLVRDRRQPAGATCQILIRIRPCGQDLRSLRGVCAATECLRPEGVDGWVKPGKGAPAGSPEYATVYRVVGPPEGVNEVMRLAEAKGWGISFCGSGREGRGSGAGEEKRPAKRWAKVEVELNDRIVDEVIRVPAGATKYDTLPGGRPEMMPSRTKMAKYVAPAGNPPGIDCVRRDMALEKALRDFAAGR
jgi:hypothetical protein